MKINQSIIGTAIIASLTIPLLAIAAEEEKVNLETIEYAYPEEAFTPCGVAQSDEEIDFTSKTKEIKIGKVSYVTGGICSDEVEQMKTLAKNYPLEVVLVEKTEEKEKEGYIADVKVKIHDAKDNLMLEVTTEGPFLLVNLPDGSYKVTAEYNNVIKTNKVNVNKKKHERIVFLWSIKPDGA